MNRLPNRRVVSAMAAAGLLLFPLLAAACAPTGFPGAGQQMRAEFSAGAYQLDFNRDGCTLTFTGLSGNAIGVNDTVIYQYTRIGDGVHKLSWGRFVPTTGAPLTTAVHIQNWNIDQVYSSFTTQSLQFIHMQGPLVRARY